MGRKGRTKNWFWIQVKLATIRSDLRIKLFEYEFFFILKFNFRKFIILKELKRNEFHIEDSFQI